MGKLGINTKQLVLFVIKPLKYVNISGVFLYILARHKYYASLWRGALAVIVLISGGV